MRPYQHADEDEAVDGVGVQDDAMPRVSVASGGKNEIDVHQTHHKACRRAVEVLAQTTDVVHDPAVMR